MVRIRSIDCLLLLSLGLTGCGHYSYNRVPTELLNAQLIDVSLPQSPYLPIDPQTLTALKKSKQLGIGLDPEQKKGPPINILAISGGGSHGAFDVGVLNGWTESGTRPKFDVVTGVSTGAFISTFVFLGPQYDGFIRDSYLMARKEDVYRNRLWLSLLWSDAIASSRPLKKKIDEAITPEVLHDVAKAHAEGRRLYVGTTNLDTHRFVIWDMTAIAASGRPDSLDLFRRIILASGSVPGFFPPVRIDVDVDGKRYQELHVDGGTTTQVFVPMLLTQDNSGNPFFRPGSNVYVICSGKLYADANTVKRQLVPVTSNVLTAIIYAGARKDITRIFDHACVAGMDFHLISVPLEISINRDALTFNPVELRILYDVGYEMGKNPAAWRHTPPDAEIPEQVIPRTGTKFSTGR